MRVLVVALALALPGGCFSWQSTYDSAARRECRVVVDAEGRQDCLTGVERNSAARRADKRS